MFSDSVKRYVAVYCVHLSPGSPSQAQCPELSNISGHLAPEKKFSMIINQLWPSFQGWLLIGNLLSFGGGSCLFDGSRILIVRKLVFTSQLEADTCHGSGFFISWFNGRKSKC